MLTAGRAAEEGRRAAAAARLEAVRATINGIPIEEPDGLDLLLADGAGLDAMAPETLEAAAVATPPAAAPPQPRRAPAQATKACTGCRKAKPLHAYGSNPASPDGRYSRCLACERVKDKARGTTEGRVARTRAMNRALYRLRDLHPAEFRRLYDQELAAARTEIEALARAAAPTGDPHPQPVRLMPGRRTATETVADRIRTDVGACPLCIGSHDTGHTCPACGATPTTEAHQP